MEMPTNLLQVMILSLGAVWSFGLHQRNPNGRLPLFLTLYLIVPILGLSVERIVAPDELRSLEWTGVFLNAGITAALIHLTRTPFPFFPPPVQDPSKDRRAAEARAHAYTLASRVLRELDGPSEESEPSGSHVHR
jgi:hypothetical protein